MTMIDCHQHFWRVERGDYGWLTPDLAPLYRDFLPTDLEPHLREAGMGNSIVVQAAPTVAETEYLLGLADTYPWILGVVGWVDFDSPDCLQQLDRLSTYPKFIGVRPMIQDLDDPNWMLNAGFRAAMDKLVALGLSFDALVKPQHLKPLRQFRDTYPQLNIIIDHCAKPDLTAPDVQQWHRDIEHFRGCERTFCKLSGLLTEAPKGANLDTLTPVIDHVVDVFGDDRILFGSDWPVLNLASDYQSWVTMVKRYLYEKPRLAEYLESDTTVKLAYSRLKY